jgi:uncharacterized protein YndB with AHSA1/START domain
MRGALWAVAVISILAICGLADAGEDAEQVGVDRLTLKTGEWWYRMVDGQDKACGYAHLIVAKTLAGGAAVVWELKIAFPGGTYEEERAMGVDADWRLNTVSYSLAGKMMVDCRRKDDAWTGTRREKPGGDAKAFEPVVPDDAITGMGFVYAAFLPQKSGISLSRTDLNETRGLESEGTCVFRCVGPDELSIDGEDVAAVRFEVKRQDGRKLPVWVNAAREVVRADWGGGMKMILGKKSTKDLFKPIPPAVAQMPSGPEKLIMRGVYANVTPERMFDLWTKPELLTKWWPPKAEVDPKVSGAYLLSWPEAKWVLDGRITLFEPGKRFAFTWKWKHEEPEAPEREVVITFAARKEGGTLLTIEHGPYADSASERKEREGHMAGWKSFGTRLAGMK